MEATKTFPDLLQNLFTFFHEKYGNRKVYEAFREGIPDQSKVVRLTIPDCPKWAKPAIFLTQLGENKKNTVLTLSVSAPQKGFNKDFSGALLAVYPSIENAHSLWLTPGDTVGGFSRVFSFREGDKVISALRIEVITKVHELFYSGDYIVEPFQFEEAIA